MEKNKNLTSLRHAFSKTTICHSSNNLINVKIFSQVKTDLISNKQTFLVQLTLSILKKINGQFCLENALILTYELFMTILRKKFEFFFLIFIITHVSMFNLFLKRNSSLIFPPKEVAQKRKC